MASFEGSIGTPSGGFNLKVEYSYTQSTAGNYSDVTAIGYVKRNKSSYYPFNSSSSASLNINGTSKGYSGSYDLRSDGYKAIVSNTVRVYHNSDGIKSIPISFSFNGLLSSYYPNGSVSQTITLNKINRYPILNSGSDFTDETNPTFNITTYNIYEMILKLEAGGNSNLITRTVPANTTNYTIELTDEERELLRELTPNSNILSVRETVQVNSNYSFKDYKMTIVNANPIFNDFEFEDIDKKTLALTGNNQNIIKGYSTVMVKIPIINKAESLKKATMNKYRFSCGNSSKDILYENNADVSGFLKNIENGTFNVYAIDSRNNSTLVAKNALEVIDYKPLSKGSISVNRKNGVSEEVILKLDGKVDLINFGQAINKIKSAKYRYKITDSNEWSEYSNLNLLIDSDGKFSYNDLIKGDTEGLGFNIGNSYQVEVTIEDELSTITYEDTFGSGIPNIALHKNGVGIMGAYDERVGGDLQIRGKKVNIQFVE